MSHLAVGKKLGTAIVVALAASIGQVQPNDDNKRRDTLVEIPRLAEPLSVTVTRLHELADAMPDGRGVASWYKTAQTITDVKLANARVAGEIVKTRRVETALGKFRGELMKSCEAVTHLDFSQVQMLTTKMQSLRKVLSDVQSELRKSVDLMRRNTTFEKPSVVAFKSRHDLRQYEVAIIEFAGLQVNAQEMEKGIAALAVNIPKAADGCAATTIPPLFSRSSMPAAKPVSKKTPRSAGPAFLRQPSGVRDTNVGAPRSW